MAMDDAEIARILARADANKAAQEAAAARGEKLVPPPAVTSNPGAEPVGTTVSTGTKNAPIVSTVTPKPGSVPSPSEPMLQGAPNAPGMVPAGTNIPATGEQAMNAIRVAGGAVPGGNVVRGVAQSLMNGDPSMSGMGGEIQNQYQKDQVAAQALGPTGAKLSEAGGAFVGAMALPGAMWSTPWKAMMTATGFNLADTVSGRLEQGKPVFENPQEYLGSAAAAAGLGLFGYHAGKTMGHMLMKLAGGVQAGVKTATFGKINPKNPITDPDIADVARRNIEHSSRQYDGGRSLMENSGVSIQGKAMAKLLNKMETLLDKSANKSAVEFSPQITPHSWAAFNDFRARATAGTDIDLAALFTLRRRMYDGIRDKFGVLLPGVTREEVDATAVIDREINNFVKTGLKSNKIGTLRKQNVDIDGGINGWNMMDADFTRKMRTEELGLQVIDAARRAGTGGVTIDKALQENFAALLTKENARHMGSLYTTQQLKIIEAIAKGSVGQHMMNRLDRWVGGPGFVGQLYRALIRSPYSSMFGAEQARAKARLVMSETGETPLVKRPGVKVGGAAGAAASTMDEGQGSVTYGLQKTGEGAGYLWDKAWGKAR